MLESNESMLIEKSFFCGDKAGRTLGCARGKFDSGNEDVKFAS
jgi:hypothetical protein